MAEEPKRDTLEERLMERADSFNALLSLMPADVYFGKDNSDQWQRKKQTKEQRQAAKRAKLDPDNVKTAKDVLDEQAAEFKKRKREEDGEEADPSVQGADVESAGIKPTQISSVNGNQSKKQKREAGDVSQAKEDSGSIKQGGSGQDASKAAKAREKRERKKAKAEMKAAKAEAKRARKAQQTALAEDSKAAAIEGNSRPLILHDDKAESAVDGAEPHANEIEAVEMDTGFAEGDFLVTASPSPETEVSTFDPPNQDSGASSISSIVPPPADKSPSSHTINPHENTSTVVNTDKAANSNTSQQDSKLEELKTRFAARIEALQSARKASNPSRGPTNRQELIESRRRKEEERKAHKKELRRKAREEEAAKRSETLARASPLLSNTNSPLLSPGSPAASTEHNNFSFSRITFPSGQRASASLDAILTPNSKPKGPSDPRTALLAAEKRQSRLATFDPDKQADIAEKDIWLNAKKRAHGERIRDDTSLLKKTLKRKEKQKKKSEKEWKERLEGVKKGQAMKQQKREMNLLKRREEKGSKGGRGSGGGSGAKAKSKATTKKARPGFEGSFKTKAPSNGGVSTKPRRR